MFVHLPCLRQDTDTANLQLDLTRFVQQVLRGRVVPPSDETRACRLLVQKAQGLFLYVSRVIEDHAGRSFTLRDIEAFPDGLRSFYDELFERVLPRADAVAAGEARRLLSVVLAAQLPVNVDFLARVLGVTTAGGDTD